MDLIALAIPAFFAFMGLEWVLARWRGVQVYRFADWVSNLGCGIIQQTFKVVLALFTLLAYRYLFEHHRLLEWDASSGWTWLFCFLGVDFCYYWFHRGSHELNFLWAAHVVHHQSEEYNLGVALRQSAFQSGFSWFFYLPLALLGFPPFVFLIVNALNALYQFWIHTRLIDRLGPFEWVFNTPSHHRVHHGRNAKYVDKNHAGTLILWDKMFGTFEREDEPVEYGVLEPVRSWNPLFANFHHLHQSLRRTGAARGWRAKLAVWTRGPGYRPPGAAEGASARGAPKYDTRLSRPLVVYVAVQHGVLTTATTAFLFLRSSVGPAELFAWGVLIVGTAGLLGALLDGSAWARPAEYARLAILGLGGAAWLLPLAGAAAAVAALALAAAWAFQLRSALLAQAGISGPPEGLRSPAVGDVL